MTSPTITPAQFARAYQLARAYGHLWATLLDRPPVVPASEDEPAVDERETAARILWDARHGRVDMAAIESLAIRHESSSFGGITTPAVNHETCTGRTKWQILPDGEVRFERVERRASYDAQWRCTDASRVLAKARVYRARSGKDVAEIDYLVPRAEWPEDAEEGVLRSLTAAGCEESEAKRAFDLADVRASVRRAA
jgi:hypothetical protein